MARSLERVPPVAARQDPGDAPHRYSGLRRSDQGVPACHCPGAAAVPAVGPPPCGAGRPGERSVRAAPGRPKRPRSSAIWSPRSFRSTRCSPRSACRTSSAAPSHWPGTALPGRPPTSTSTLTVPPSAAEPVLGLLLRPWRDGLETRGSSCHRPRRAGEARLAMAPPSMSSSPPWICTSTWPERAVWSASAPSTSRSSPPSTSSSARPLLRLPPALAPHRGYFRRGTQV